MITRTNAHTHSLNVVRFLVNHPRSGTCLSVHHMHTHTHTLVPQEGCRGYTHILTQCSLSSGNSKRGARGRLISYSHTHSPFPGEPSQVRDFSVCSSHAHTHTHILWYPKRGAGDTHTYSLNVVCLLVTPRGVPGEGLSLTHTHTVRFLVNHPRSGTSLSVHHMHTHTHILWYPKRGAGDTHTYSFNVVCPLVTPRGVPGEGLSLTHTHTVRFLVNHPRSGTSLSVHHMHTHTHTLVPQEGCRGYTHILTQCSLSPGNSERGARGRLISYSHTHSPFPGEPSQVRDFSVCSSHAHTHTHTLVPQEGCRGYTHILIQCSLSSGNSERGARGRLISYSHTHSPFPGEPSQVRDFSVCSSHAHTHTYSGTPRGVPGIHTHTHSM